MHTAGDDVQALEQIQIGDLNSVEYAESPTIRMIREYQAIGSIVNSPACARL